MGVSNWGGVASRYQFLFSNGTRTKANESEKRLKDKSMWKDHRIPEGSTIAKVETLVSRGYAKLYGVRFYDPDGAVLLSVGAINRQKERNDPDFVIKELYITEREVIVGVRSGGNDEELARHYNF